MKLFIKNLFFALLILVGFYAATEVFNHANGWAGLLGYVVMCVVTIAFVVSAAKDLQKLTNKKQ